jgi:hypothetical protein
MIRPHFPLLFERPVALHGEYCRRAAAQTCRTKRGLSFFGDRSDGPMGRGPLSMAGCAEDFDIDDTDAAEPGTVLVIGPFG